MRRSIVRTIALALALGIAALGAQPAVANAGREDGQYGSPGR